MSVPLTECKEGRGLSGVDINLSQARVEVLYCELNRRLYMIERMNACFLDRDGSADKC